MDIVIPEFCLVLLVGPSGCGKSTFARQHFQPSEVVSSDALRAAVSNDENNPVATRDAFEVLHLIVAKRLAAGHLTVVDATNLQAAARRPLLALARQYSAEPVAIVFDLPEDLCYQRNANRPERRLTIEAVHRQHEQLERAMAALPKEGFQPVYTLQTVQQVEQARVARQRLAVNKRDERGPFDIIGDVHGCGDELEELLAMLGYRYEEAQGPLARLYPRRYFHPVGRKAVFVGDLVDRGPRVADVFLLTYYMAQSGSGFCVLGNHDDKLLRKLRGHIVQVTHGLETTLRQIEAVPEEAREALIQAIIQFFSHLPSHFVFDRGRLVVAHAGIKKNMIGKEGGRVREFTLYGETTGETDEYGLPVRRDWAAHYHGRAIIAYGHTGVTRAEWVNNTIDIDTGVVYGGSLTALRYPELELVSVAAKRVYREPSHPLHEPGQGGSKLPGNP